MEVHHHPHVEKKKFKEYCFEFLMIFLAVTMGFFAESVRENISNNEHAKLLTRQLVKDLETDTLNLTRIINFEDSQRRTIDTLFFLLQQPIATADTKSIQQLIFNSYALELFNPSEGAISAIEKELNIKQFAGTELPGLITYYKHLTSVNKEGENLVMRLIEEHIETFMYAHFMPMNAYNVFAKNGSVIEAGMRNLTQEGMTDLSVKMMTIGGLISSMVSLEEKLKEEAKRIIEYVVKQFNLTTEGKL